MAIEGAAAVAVAHDPILVGEGRLVINGDGIVPREPIVRTASENGYTSRVDECDRTDKPFSVSSIIGDGSIAGSLILSPFVESGDAGQPAVLPSGATVGRRRKANIRRTAIGDSTSLECGHDGRAEGVRVRFDFGGMLAGGISEGIRA